MKEENANDAASVAFALADICDGKMRGDKQEQHEQTKASVLSSTRKTSAPSTIFSLTVFQAFDASGIMAHLAVSANHLILLMLLILHSFQDFENTLKDVVNAKRLSQSKMNRLTEIAMKSLEVRVYMLLEDSHC
jgi:hypothetical protein